MGNHPGLPGPRSPSCSSIERKRIRANHLQVGRGAIEVKPFVFRNSPLGEPWRRAIDSYGADIVIDFTVLGSPSERMAVWDSLDYYYRVELAFFMRSADEQATAIQDLSGGRRQTLGARPERLLDGICGWMVERLLPDRFVRKLT